MATDTGFIDYVVEQVGLGSRLTKKKMFGEYAIYLDGTVVAFACDNSLFIKPTDAAKRLAPNVPQRAPYPGAKLYPVVDELLDDTETLQRLILDTSRLLPPAKPKRIPKRATK